MQWSSFNISVIPIYLKIGSLKFLKVSMNFCQLCQETNLKGFADEMHLLHKTKNSSVKNKTILLQNETCSIILIFKEMQKINYLDEEMKGDKYANRCVI